jgi:hypothetical protein
LSDSDASFIVKGGWNTVVGYRPQLARSGRGFVTGLVLPRGNAADSPHLFTMVKEQITNTGVTPSLASADDGYSTQQGREVSYIYEQLIPWLIRIGDAKLVAKEGKKETYAFRSTE